MTSEDMVEDPLISFQFYKNKKSFFISCYSQPTVFFLIAKDAWICFFVPRYESLKLNHDTNCLMTSDDTNEDPLMSVQFYINSKSFFISFLVHLPFSFLLQKTLESVFLPR